jgi:hypothetical protein
LLVVLLDARLNFPNHSLPFPRLDENQRKQKDEHVDARYG